MKDKMASKCIVIIIWIFSCVVAGYVNRLLKSGPVFLKLPPNKITFLRSRGFTIDCLGSAFPSPKIEWWTNKEQLVKNTNAIKVHENGSLSFHSIAQEDYRHNLQSEMYQCKISNDFGTIISPLVKVSIVSDFSMMIPRVYDEYTIKGCTAVLKCRIPGFSKDNVEVVAWYMNNDLIKFNSKPKSSDEYSLSVGGNLFIKSVNRAHEGIAYKCKVRNKITLQEETNKNAGYIHVTDTQNALQPNINTIKDEIMVKKGENIILPCAAQGFPPPSYNWSKLVIGKSIKTKALQLDSGSLFLTKVTELDEGLYECQAYNNIGFDNKQTKLIILVELRAFIQPERQILDIGGPLNIECSYSGQPIKQISWYRNGLPLNITGKYLRLKDTNENGVGSYQCFVQNEKQIVQATCSVFAGNRIPIFTAKFASVTINPGISIKLKCAAKGLPRPVIKWFLDGEEIQRTGNIDMKYFFKNVDEIESSIYIKNSTVKDGGEYRCIASNKIGEIEHMDRVNVYGPPFIRLLKNATVADGSNLLLRCHSAGYPLSKIIWTRGGRNLWNRRMKSFDNGTLLIRNVEILKDEGKYKCTSYGMNGDKFSRFVWVHILVAPVIYGNTPPQLGVGDSLTLSCNVLRGTQPININWLKNNKSISFENGLLTSKTSVNSNLQVKSLKRHHEGNYTCIASNAAGNDEWMIKINVNYPPKILTTKTFYWVTEGQRVIIDCLANGSPRPVIEWFREEEIISDTESYAIKKNNSLLIKRVSNADNGIFTCSASNGISPSAYLDIHIFVGKSPQMKCHRRTNKSKLYLICKVKGTFPIEISWEKANTIVEEKNYTVRDSVFDEEIEIKLLVERNGRNQVYRCFAENKFGVDNYTFYNINEDKAANPEIFSDDTILIDTIPSVKSVLLQNFDSELNEAPIEDYKTTYLPDINEVLPAIDRKGKERKVTFLQILIASITTAVIILLFVLLLILIVLWKKRSDKRDEQENKYENQTYENGEDYDMNTLDNRYGSLRPASPRSVNTFPETNYYASITPYATFNKSDINDLKEETTTLRITQGQQDDYQFD